MPRLRFREQGLDPDLAFPHGLGIPLRVVIAAHPVEKGLLQAPPSASAALRCRALGTKRAGGAGRGRGFVHPSPGRLALGEEPQALAPGTVVGISRHVVDEIGRTKETGPAPDCGQREIRTNLLTLDGGNVLDRATVPYLLPPVTWRGHSFQRNRVHQSRSRAGWFSCTSAGATKAARMI